MKPFRFSLDGALRWRESQSDQEEERLTKLFAEKKGLDSRKAVNDHARVTASKSQLQTGQLPGSDFRSLGAYLLGLDAHAALLKDESLKCNHRIEQQQASCVVARRNVKLLDLLRSKRHKTWLHEADRELETAAAESHLARRARENSD